MIKIRWKYNCFESFDEKLKQWNKDIPTTAIISNKDFITKFLKGCDFQLMGYRLNNNNFDIEIMEGVFIQLKDEGTGFIALFYLLGLLKKYESIAVIKSSVRGLFHPTLLEALESLESLDSNRAECTYISPLDVRHFLKCAINPSENCEKCLDYTPAFLPLSISFI